jgi:hypothetical protein
MPSDRIDCRISEEEQVIDEREAIREKARARRRRREEGKSVRKASGTGKTVSGAALPSLSEKVVDLAQEAAAQLSALVQSAASKIAGAGG